jgi:hypothetical protein
MISPNIITIPVVMSKPAMPEVKSAMKIDKIEFTETFPRRIVQIKRLPLFLNGRIRFA